MGARAVLVVAHLCIRHCTCATMLLATSGRGGVVGNVLRRACWSPTLGVGVPSKRGTFLTRGVPSVYLICLCRKFRKVHQVGAHAPRAHQCRERVSNMRVEGIKTGKSCIDVHHAVPRCCKRLETIMLRRSPRLRGCSHCNMTLARVCSGARLPTTGAAAVYTIHL
jgi:hypothetical protein